MSVSLAGRRFEAQRRLLGAYLAPQRARIALVAVLVLADIGLRLVNPQIVRLFLDTAQAGGPLSALTLAGILYLVVGLLGRGVSLASAWAGLSLGWAATNRLRGDLAAHLLRLDMPFHKAHTPGELIERVDGDVTALAEFFAEMFVKAAGNAVLVLGILALLYRENARVGLLLTGYTLLVIIALALIGRLASPRWVAARQAWSEAMGFLEERFGGTEDIRGVGSEAHQQGRLRVLMLNVLRRSRAGFLANAVGHVTVNLLFVVGYAMGLAAGATLYLNGQATIGGAFLIAQYIGMLSSPLEAIRWQVEQFQQGTAGAQRVNELLNLKPDVPDAGEGTLPTGPLRVDFDHVDFRYSGEGEDGGGLVLRDVVVSVSPGRSLGVLGRTGSGKTTLTRLLLRLYDPERGAIRLNGTDIRELPFATLRSAVGLVTQDVQLFGATVRENITLFDDTVSTERVEAALASLGLLEWVRAMPNGLDTLLTPGGGMSGGEAQLLAFARILLRDPGLVILDEAASRLDPLTERRLERAVERLLKGNGHQRTSIIIAHRLSTVQAADDILILEGGEVVEFGEHDALAADPRSRFSHLLRTGLEEALA